MLICDIIYCTSIFIWCNNYSNSKTFRAFNTCFSTSIHVFDFFFFHFYSFWFSAAPDFYSFNNSASGIFNDFECCWYVSNLMCNFSMSITIISDTIMTVQRVQKIPSCNEAIVIYWFKTHVRWVIDRIFCIIIDIVLHRVISFRFVLFLFDFIRNANFPTSVFGCRFLLTRQLLFKLVNGF